MGYKLTRKEQKEYEEFDIFKSFSNEIGTLKTYEMSAECLADIGSFLSRTRVYYFTIKKENLPLDLNIEFKTYLEKNEIIDVLSKIKYGKVMKKTLKLKKD